MIEIRWHGRGGQGAFTASRLLGLSAALFEGKFALAFPAFGPERRGAPVQAFTRIDDKKITDRSEIESCDHIVVLDESLVNKSMYNDLKPGGTLLINTRHPEKLEKSGRCRIIAIDATSIALKVLKKPVTNTAMLGALLGASNIISLDSALKGIQKEMGEIAEKNIEVLKLAYETVKEGVNGKTTGSRI
ncbi:2-oxoacid:acceptor oxidoreductase family protein [Thermoanaerobacterium sp. DL9XJH110]|uniref:2-oxoacid:acceptor oxidoreductase family protein n=1 Tax=Thermoanaerobacterium sp. DL9XJH110 TaxID=3386643 RepID=UPI003BB575F6